MAPFKPNSTIYLCSGTGMDMSNSIWWQRFAYPKGDSTEQESWWNTCFQWFKAHSIAEGYWNYTTVDTTRGYVRVGRTYQDDGSIPQGQSGLGNATKQAMLNDPNVPYIEALRAVDYIVFVNDFQENATGIADVQYAFVTNITSVNYSTADIHFEIDGIMTYQKFFHLGKCPVDRDMQFQERIGSETGIPNYENINRYPEPFEPSETDFVFRKIVNIQERNPNIQKLVHLGKFNKCFVLTDVDLQPDRIKPNEYYGGLPSFESSDFTIENGTNLGIGTYYIPHRKNPSFQLLGAYNAMEHILYTYLVPENLIDSSKASTNEVSFIDNTNNWLSQDYTFSPETFYIPNGFDDSRQIGNNPNEYKPINIKCYNAPFRYYSITDKQGGSIEIQAQLLDSTTDDEDHFFNMFLGFEPCIGANTASALIIYNSLQTRGTEVDPYTTLWQMPSYSMTPNNSGYNSLLVNSVYQKNMAQEMILMGGSITIAANLVNTTANIAGMAYGASAGAGAGGIGAMAGSRVGGSVGGNVASMITQPFEQVGTGILGGGVTALNGSLNNLYSARANAHFGLPKAVGGLPQGYTYFTMNDPGYIFYVVQMRTHLMKQLDFILSAYGYNQNGEFRYPHINIRRRWCYTKVQDVNIIPQEANSYNSGGIPFRIREQIENRLKNGITWWNLRQGIMGDADSGASTATSYTDPRITNTIHCKFVKNYGSDSQSDEIKENMSFTGGYASDYTDDV